MQIYQIMKKRFIRIITAIFKIAQSVEFEIFIYYTLVF